MGQNIESDITLKELFEKIADYFKDLLGSWKRIFLCGLLMAIVLTMFHIRDVPRYKASLTFMLNEDESGSLGGLSGLLGQFGFSSSSSESNLDKILELSRARRISQNALFEKASIDGKSDFIANHVIESLVDLRSWKSGGVFSFLGGKDSLDVDSFRFTKDDVDSFSDLENKALKRLHHKITGVSDSDSPGPNGLFLSSYSELTGIMSFAMTTSSQDLSIATVNSFFENLSAYYIEKSTEKQLYDYGIIKSKYDSIVNRLSNVQYELAQFQDSNFKVFRKKDLLTEKRLKTEEQKLAIMLGEAEKQVQISEITLENKTPYIQVIDTPIKPLKPINKSLVYHFLIGGILGGFLCILFLVFRKMYYEIMNS